LELATVRVPRVRPRTARGTNSAGPTPAPTIGWALRSSAEVLIARMGWSWMVRPHGLYRLLAPVIARVGGVRSRRTGAALKRFLEAREGLAPEAS
jgi:hypothetical protein